MDKIYLDGKIFRVDDLGVIVDDSNKMPTKSELKALKKMLSNPFNSKKLNKIASINPNIKSMDYLINVINQIDAALAEEYKENFYNNLEGLTVTFSDDKAIENAYAGYDTVSNQIMISTKGASLLKDEQDKLNFMHVLRHELLHMASNNLFKNMLSVLEVELNDNTAFQEGYTELVNENFDSLSCGYEFEIRLIAQLTFLVDANVVANAYYNDLGIDPIVEELDKKFHGDSFEFFFNLEMGTSSVLTKKARFDNLMKAQGIILDYADIELERLKNTSDQFEIDDVIYGISSNFINDDVLMQNNLYLKVSVYKDILKKLNNIIKKYEYNIDDCEKVLK